MSGKPKNGYERPMDLSHPKALETFKKSRKKHWTQEEARRYLVELGIYTKTGKLTKHYR